MTAAVVWLTGLPASGKSALAAHLAARLREARLCVVTLDGDDVREALVPRPGHDEPARDHYYRSLAGLAALIARQDVIAIVPATAHRRIWRDAARAMAPRFIEVHVATPLAECRRRDPKQLYARQDDLPWLPGVGVAYEPPLRPDLVAPTGDDPQIVDAMLALLGVSSP